jgi:RNA polymerase sigma factor (sigma-70 family)
MTEAHPDPIPRCIRHLIGSAAAAALTDGQLLERFLADRDETAVEALVRRHGPLVFGACRRVLHNSQAAEDAFQATFLVLLRKAPSLDRGRPLGNWLYTVAYRLALRARANDLRRQRCEAQAARRRPPTEARAPAPGDLVVALEEELHRLPPRHRAVLVLCYLEGKTNEQAARILGCHRGRMSARLAQARERLRERLARQGFVAPAAGLAAALATAAPAAVPLPLLDNTVRASLWFAREGGCATGFVSAQAVTLARGAFRTMFLNKLKIAAALLLTVAMLGTGATLLLHAAPQPETPPPPEARPRPAEAPGAGADRAGNATPEYRQAFVALRRFNQDKVLAECLTMPPDAQAREIVTRGAYALRMMHRGVARPRCDWGIRWEEEGVGASNPHEHQVQVLASLACLRARLRFEDSQSAGALDDLVAALTLARHVSQDGSLDGLWAGYAIEQRAGDVLARSLPGLDAPTIRDLQKRLEALPTGGSVAAATLRMQGEFLDWIAGEVREAQDRESLLAFLSQLGVGPRDPEKRRAEGRALLEECGGTPEGVLKRAGDLRPGLARLAGKLDLPPDQVGKEWEREVRALTGNPLFKIFSPVLQKVRVRRDQAVVRRALLAAALAVRLDGPGALRHHPDPVFGGPFDHAAFEGGFELRSKGKLDDQPVVLTAGRRRS